MHYYQISTKTSCEADKVWAEDFEQKYCCPECYELLPQHYEKGIDVHLVNNPGIAALNYVASIMGVQIARRDFLSLFENEVQQNLILGKVYIKGQLCEKYVSYIGKQLITVRGAGNGNSTFQGRCSQCGALIYYAGYPKYIVRRDIIDQPLAASWPDGRIIITEELRLRIEPNKWKGIHITEFPVVEEPKDGFDLGPSPIEIWKK